MFYSMLMPVTFWAVPARALLFNNIDVLLNANARDILDSAARALLFNNTDVLLNANASDVFAAVPVRALIHYIPMFY